MGDAVDQESILGFLLGLSAEKVYDFIAKNYTWGEPSWEDQYEHGAKKRILEKCGDFYEEYLGDKYDQKFAWVDLGTATEAELSTLKKYKLPFLGGDEIAKD